MQLGTLRSKNAVPRSKEVDDNEKAKELGAVETTKKWLAKMTKGKQFHRTQEEKNAYETILGVLHKTENVNLIERYHLEYSRTNLYEKGTRQVFIMNYFVIIFIIMY